MSILMKCGHSDNAKRVLNNGEQIPACVICGCTEVAETPIDLTGRKARCTYYGSKCHSEIDSRLNLAFFNHKPDSKYDEYYCGCWGWN
jgi:hypothetical protein